MPLPDPAVAPEPGALSPAGALPEPLTEPLAEPIPLAQPVPLAELLWFVGPTPSAEPAPQAAAPSFADRLVSRPTIQDTGMVSSPQTTPEPSADSSSTTQTVPLSPRPTPEPLADAGQPSPSLVDNPVRAHPATDWSAIDWSAPGVPAPQQPRRLPAPVAVAPPEPRYFPPLVAPPRPKPTFFQRAERFFDATSRRQPRTVLEQLREGPPADRLIGWVTTLVITLVAFGLRFWNLGFPKAIMFDETFYAKDAYTLWHYGYEASWSGDPTVVNQQFADGDTSAMSPTGSFIVHPPVGKWLIGLGEHIFGVTPFGYRFFSLIFGTLLVFITIRLGRRLARSTLIGAIAGILLTFDGLAFVMSRIALLDIFEAFFIVAGVAAVVADRDFFRHRLADALAKTSGESFAGRAGPFVFRPWLIVAGLMFGLGVATKWNAMYPLAVGGVLVVAWSVSARRLAGARDRAWWALLKDGVPAFISMVVVAVGVYIASWAGWFATSGGYDRQWGAKNPDAWSTQHFGTALASLLHYQVDMWNWDTGTSMAEATHAYASNPWGWPVLARTIGIYADNGIQPGDQGCAAAAGSTCLRVITGLGTPLIWWAATVALLAALIWWLAGLDWRFAVPVLMMCSTWIPWMFAGTRPKFAFYAITMIPFMVIALAMALGVILGPADAGRRRQRGAIIVGTYLGLVVIDFAFNYPIYTGALLSRLAWLARMWLPGWI